MGMNDDPRVIEAVTRLTHWKIPELRHVQVEGLTDGGFIRFEYDEDGYMRVYELSDNLQYIEEKTGKKTPPWWETNAAWVIAYDAIPKSNRHLSNTQPIGTVIDTERYVDDRGMMVPGRCEVIGYQGTWQCVRFEDGDERSIPMPPFKESR